MLKAAENKDRHAEKNAERRPVLAPNHNGEIHENSAEHGADKCFRCGLGKLSLTQRERLLAKCRQGETHRDTGDECSNQISGKREKRRRNIRLPVRCDEKTDLACEQRKAAHTDAEQRHRKQDRADIFVVAGEIHAPADAD